MNAVFTIVAKNYLPLARTLGDSLKKYHPELAFYIIIADVIDGDINIDAELYTIIPAVDLDISNLENLAFKYNITEYCTALKPYAFKYLFQKFDLDKIIYFDPDIYVFNKLDLIFAALDNNFIVLTPHFVYPELDYTGAVPEGNILFTGIFNLGFCAISNSEKGNFIIEWWINRLIDKAYADRIDAYHTDQKWMDFVPALFESGVYILRNLGCNMAIWNIHERVLFQSGEIYSVLPRIGEGNSEDLLFFHFAGFDPNNQELVHKHHPAFPLHDFPEVKPLMVIYKDAIMANGFETSIITQYTYNIFDNGILVNHFHRRLYRSLTENGYNFANPFNTGKDSFYDLLKRNKLLSENGVNIDAISKSNYNGVDRKIKILHKILTVLKNVIGFEKYTLLLKFAFRISRPENQTFLLKEVENRIGFVSEESYPPNFIHKIKRANKYN